MESKTFKNQTGANLGLVVFLTHAVKHYYELTFPQLTLTQRVALVCRNPVYIYLALRTLQHLPKHDQAATEAQQFLRLHAEHNTGPRRRRVFATSDFTFYADSLPELRSGGDIIGIIAHEIAHSADDIAPERTKDTLDKIVSEFGVVIKPEDYAIHGEEELFADLMALAFHAKLGGDETRRNDLIYEYARRRELPEHLYRPFLKEGLPDPGLALDRSLVVDQLKEEYDYVSNKVCMKCGGEFDTSRIDRKSYVVYHKRLHDVLRLYCQRCGRKQDFFFDYTNTIPMRSDFRDDYIASVASTHGEIKDPIPGDLFDSAPPPDEITKAK